MAARNLRFYTNKNCGALVTHIRRAFSFKICFYSNNINKYYQQILYLTSTQICSTYSSSCPMEWFSWHVVSNCNKYKTKTKKVNKC